ncbi:VWA domain-containing protein [Pannonibacter sp. Pt2]|uniref:VWA domain-containing protein n=1 Tax=Pannonibacter anstelovis TaxID=3121537 RepID=A0ABU7ZQ24_9HYPH
MKSIQLKTAALLAATIFCPPLAAVAQEAPRTIIVMDGSGSMWGQIDGRAKLEIAREAVARVVQGIPAQQELGLLAYGHRSKGNCGDIELLVPPGQGSGAAVVNAVNSMRFLGKTPLSAAVRQAAEALRYGEESATVVLVTDGLETCEADPCALASELEAAGVNFTAHVVGFGLTKEEGAQVACLAENTGGRYIEAANAGELADALTEAISMEPPKANTHFPGKPLMPSIQLQPTGAAIGAETAVPAQPDFPRTGTAEDCRALAEADANAAAWNFEPPGSYFVEEPRCRLYSYSTEMDWAVSPPEDGWVSGFKPDAILFVRPLEEPAFQPGKAGMINRGPYAVGVAQIELGVLAEGTETGGAALALRLYPAGNVTEGSAITYSTVEGTEGAKDAAIELAAPGEYTLRLETWGGDKLDEMEIVVEPDPAVTLTAPAAVEPGSPIAIETRGSQLRSDGIEIWQGEQQIDWGRTLSELAAGQSLNAPSEPGTYDLVYKGYDASGERKEKARVSIEVGTSNATGGGGAPRQKKAEAGSAPVPGAASGADGEAVYSCDGPAPCSITDGSTGLSFMLPAGWWTDQPVTEGYTAGAQASGETFPPRVNFFRHGADDTLVLGPRQWLAMNGPCDEVGTLGQFCMFESTDPQVLAAFQLVKATLKWEQPQAAKTTQADQTGFAASVQQGLAGQDAQTKAMIGALLGAAQNAGPNGEIDQKAMMGALLGAVQGAAQGTAPAEAGGCGDSQGHGPDHCENGKEAGGKAWTDYPHRCLPGDKTVDSCDMRDAATNLAFYLPEGWVADVTPAAPFPRVEFAENTGSTHSIWLNPADWPLGERGCEITRVGRLCTDPDRGDEKLASVFRTLQFTLTTGKVLRRCGDEPCEFGFKGSPVSGHLPARWSVELGETLPDGRVRTWFWDMDRSGNFKLMGLNQPGGQNCQPLQPGDEICEFTSNIPQEESSLIINMIVPPAPQDRKPALQASPPRTLAPDEMKALLDLIGRN